MPWNARGWTGRSANVVAITPTEWPFLKRMSWRPIPYVLAGAIVLVLGSGNAVDGAAPNRGAALCELLATRGLLCSGAPVWLSGPSGIHGAMKDGAKALVRARTSGEPLDLYLVDARLSPEGVLLDAGSAYDLTRTSQADEGPPIVRGSRVAYTTTLDGSVTAIHTIDLNGPPSKSYEDFTKTQRLQTELTNLQQLGLPHGVVHDAFVLDPIAKSVTLAWLSDDAVEARSDGRRIVIDAARAIPIEGAGWVRPVPEEKARPGGLAPWAVDRVRAMAWFGDVRMQWLKAIVFTALDSVLRARASVVDTSASEIENDLGGVNTGAASATPAEPDPDTGWPPAPLKPILSPPLPGEGQWITLDHDPFITKIPGLHAPFVTTFVRTDKERKDTRVYVTLWDPREVSLHMQAGTVEPVSATGEGGPGMIPRAPEVMKRVVAGFNGGFQAMHGEYGMQADGILYLPPKPYAATVLELRDGTTAFGAWPASQTVPDEVLSFRQNLTAIVEGGKYNPWGRYWWGGTPPGWQDNIHTTRSGICLTQDKFVGYFYGNDIAADALGAGMLAAHCSFGVHLDMNPGLAGFEFYDIEPSATWKPLGRPLQADWEYEGTVRDLPDLHVRARRMTRGMVEVNFPQYIHREARDFFYLTARAMVPGSVVEPGPRGFGGVPPRGGGGIHWSPRGGSLPGEGPTAARVSVRHRDDDGPPRRLASRDPCSSSPRRPPHGGARGKRGDHDRYSYDRLVLRSRPEPPGRRDGGMARQRLLHHERRARPGRYAHRRGLPSRQESGARRQRRGSPRGDRNSRRGRAPRLGRARARRQAGRYERGGDGRSSRKTRLWSSAPRRRGCAGCPGQRSGPIWNPHYTSRHPVDSPRTGAPFLRPRVL
jgi:hypothetical protein